MGDSILHRHDVCVSAFDRFLAVARENDGTSALLLAISDEYGRFKVWARNIGAHQKGSVSLDHRLREADHVKRQIVKILTYLAETLDEAASALRRDKSPVSDSASSDSDSLSASSIDATDLVRSENSARSNRTELDELSQMVIRMIANLYKMSFVIRSNPAPHDRLLRSTKIDTSFYEPFDISHTREKFPFANEKLIERLGRGISRRRQYLLYRERHHQKISAPALYRPERPTPFADQAHEQASNVPHRAEEQATNQKATSSASVENSSKTGLSRTTASTFLLPNQEVPNIDHSDTASEATTRSSYTASTVSEYHVSYLPPLPKSSEKRTEFECPYCYTICRLRGKHKVRGWKHHIFQDLQPYMCTSRDCQRPSTMYDSRRQWIDHELRSHRREWSCNVPNHEAYPEKSSFMAHMQSHHQSDQPEKDLERVADLCERPMSSTSAPCPLCINRESGHLSVEEFEKHVGNHLEEIALFALPRINSNAQIDSNNSSLGSHAALGGSGSSRSLSTDSTAPVWMTYLEVEGNRSSAELEPLGKPDPLSGPRLSQPDLKVADSSNRAAWFEILEEISDYAHHTSCLTSELTKTWEGTGGWLFKTAEYNQWLHETDVILLFGVHKAMSGKSNICANVVHRLTSDHHPNSDIGITYLFVRRETPLANHQAWLVQSLLSQMFDSSIIGMPTELLQLYLSNPASSNKKKAEADLESILVTILRQFKITYVAIDALDRDPTLLEWLSHFMLFVWRRKIKVKLFLTSRFDLATLDFFSDSPEMRVEVATTEPVTTDIRLYIRGELEALEEKVLGCSVQDVVDRIQDRCHGTFTWALEQVDLIRHEPSLPAMELLEPVPNRVIELWESMLSDFLAVADEDRHTAADILSRLFAAQRPLSLEELANGIQMDIDEMIMFLYRCRTILHLSVPPSPREDFGIRLMPAFKFAHPEIRHCLRSLESHPTLHQFHVDDFKAHYEFTRKCLIWLLGLKDRDNRSIITIPGLLLYAAEYWFVHFKKAAVHSRNRLEQQATDLFSSNMETFSKWLMLYDPDTGLSLIKQKRGNSTSNYGTLVENFLVLADRIRDDQKFATPLYYASLLDLPTTLMVLLDKGHDVNSKGGRHNYPLLAAIETNSSDAVRLLLLKGAHSNVRYKNQDTGLMRTASKQNREILGLLLDAGAKLDPQQKKSGETALHMAVKGRHDDPRCVDILLTAGADKEAKDIYGKTPLLWAAQFEFLEITKALLQKGANVNAQDLEGNTAIHLANSTRLIKALAEAGALIDAKNASDQTALYEAVDSGIFPKIRWLLDLGANPDRATGGPHILAMAFDRYARDISDVEVKRDAVPIIRLMIYHSRQKDFKPRIFPQMVGFLAELGEVGRAILKEDALRWPPRQKDGKADVILDMVDSFNGHERAD